MTDGVFNAPAPENVAADPQIDPALQARLEAKDAFIKQLETENAEMRDAVRAKEVEAEAQRLLAEARKAANPAPTPAATPAAVEPAKPQATEDELVERVLKAQEQRTAEQRATANAKTVVDHLVELYGSQEAANKVVNDRADELGVDTGFLLNTAKQSPGAFYELMKLQTTPKQEAAPRGDVNTAALAIHAPGVKEGTNAYYEKIRKELGDAKYFTPKIQTQRFKDAQRLGEAFFN